MRSPKLMMRSRQSPLMVQITGCTVFIYAVLVVISASCGIVHAEQGRDSHHHQGKGSAAQSAFCAWACQITSQAAEAAEPPDTAIQLILETALSVVDSSVTSSSRVGFPSRAPPCMPLLVFG